jgi:rhamnosyltransferase subunit B
MQGSPVDFTCADAPLSSPSFMPQESLRILIAALGSHGDVHPFLAVAKALRNKGHKVTLIAPAMYEELSTSLSIDFAPIGTIDEFEKAAKDPDLWHATRSLKVIADNLSPMNEAYYKAIATRNAPGRTVVVHSTLAFGARVAQEVLKIPTVTVHLSPAIIRSLVRPAYLPPLPVAAWEPTWLKRLIFGVVDRLLVDPLLAPNLNRFRATFGLPPVKGIFRDWLNSPDRVLGLFPEWYASPASDWPKQLVLTGFPLYDEADVTPMDERLSSFLAEGEAPIAFTPGSAMQHGQKFFIQAIEACRMLGRRGLLLTRHAETVPSDLPAQVRHVDYAPFSRLFPRCAAVVHHGGIGTSAQGLAGGVPQLVMPMAHDQPDNAVRLNRLGVGLAIPATKFTTRRAATALSQLLNSSTVAQSCRIAKEKCNDPDVLPKTVQCIEETLAAR